MGKECGLKTGCRTKLVLVGVEVREEVKTRGWIHNNGLDPADPQVPPHRLSLAVAEMAVASRLSLVGLHDLCLQTCGRTIGASLGPTFKCG